MHRHPKDHRKDRFVILDHRKRVVFRANFEIWKGAIALAFTNDVKHHRMHRLIMKDGWDMEGAWSAIIASLALRSTPKNEHSRKLGVSSDAWYEVKSLQSRIRKNQDWTFTVPKIITDAAVLLENRYKALSGDDVAERLEGLRDTFSFLVSKGIPEDRVREVWKEEECRFVLES
jgi:hypothetical protein